MVPFHCVSSTLQVILSESRLWTSLGAYFGAVGLSGALGLFWGTLGSLLISNTEGHSDLRQGRRELGQCLRYRDETLLILHIYSF